MCLPSHMLKKIKKKDDKQVEKQKCILGTEINTLNMEQNLSYGRGSSCRIDVSPDPAEMSKNSFFFF